MPDGRRGLREVERHEPLPGLLALPAFLLRRLSGRGRVIAALAAGVVLVGIAGGGLLVVAPARESARQQATREAERAAADRRASELAAAREQRPVEGRVPVGGREPRPRAEVRRRVRMLEGVERAVAADARARPPAGRPAAAVRGVRCASFPRTAPVAHQERDLRRPVGRFGCLAVVREFGPTSGNEGGSLGYPYRALVDFRTGAYSFCRISERAGEGGLTRPAGPGVPRACGG